MQSSFNHGCVSSHSSIEDRKRKRQRRLARMVIRDGELEGKGMSVWTNAQKDRINITGPLPMYQSKLNMPLFMSSSGSSGDSSASYYTDARSKKSKRSIFGNWARRHDPAKRARSAAPSNGGKRSTSPYKRPASAHSMSPSSPPSRYGQPTESHIAQSLFGIINPVLDFGYKGRVNRSEGGDIEYWQPPLQARGNNYRAFHGSETFSEYEYLPGDRRFPQLDPGDTAYSYYYENPTRHGGRPSACQGERESHSSSGTNSYDRQRYARDRDDLIYH